MIVWHEFSYEETTRIYDENGSGLFSLSNYPLIFQNVWKKLLLYFWFFQKSFLKIADNLEIFLPNIVMPESITIATLIKKENLNKNSTLNIYEIKLAKNKFLSFFLQNDNFYLKMSNSDPIIIQCYEWIKNSILTKNNK